MDGVWLRTFHPSTGDRPVILCFPHGGGTASDYRALSAAVAAKAELKVVQYPGRQDRMGDPMVADLPSIAAAVVAELPQSTRPIAVFGHSMGATIAFEAARLLERRGQVVSTLFASGRPAPQIPEGGLLHLVNDAGLIADIRRLGRPDAADLLTSNPDLADMVLPFVRNDYKAVETYRFRPGPKLACPIVALVADADPTVTIETAQGWAEQTTGTFETAEFTGGHFHLDDNLAAVAELITR